MNKKNTNHISNYPTCEGDNCTREGNNILEVAIGTLGILEFALCDKCINLFRRLKNRKFKRR